MGKFGTRQSEIRSGVERILKAHHVRLDAATYTDSIVDKIQQFTNFVIV